MPLPPLALLLLLGAPPPEAPHAPPAAPSVETRATDPWGPLRFLVGTWKAEEGGGKPGEAVAGGFTFAIELDGKIAVRRAHSSYAPRPGQEKGVFHEDLTVIQPKEHGFRAWYWDNEGHLIPYAVRSEAGTVIFESEPGRSGPRFRLVYARRGADLVEITFSIAPPGKPFQPYVTGLARRVREGG